jgi:isochorismate synthase
MNSTLQHQTCIEQQLAHSIASYIQKGLSIALWKKPKTQTLHLIVDTSGEIKKVPLQIEDLPKGFIIHPFEDQEDGHAYFLEANHHFQFSLDSDIEIENDWETENLLPKKVASKLIHERIKKDYAKVGIEDEDTKKEDFLRVVEEGIQAVTSGSLLKVVPAKVKRMALNEDFDVVDSIINLCKSYPNSFINFFHLSGLGTWIGASPEVLIETEGNEFHTMSLAGTQIAKGENPLKNASWTQKEIEEQALVSRYIVDCFKKIRLREYLESGPKTVTAGNLLHLKSDFKVDMQATNFPQLGSVMLQLLHPTSAVCGMPRTEALNFLKKHEKFNRSFFAGFLGPVNIEQGTAIFVNLRTARLMGDYALLYAGAGVTEDSNPEKEWEETEIKCEIIGVHLNQNSKN